MDASFSGGIPVGLDGGVHVLLFGMVFDPGGFHELVVGDVDDVVNGFGLEMVDGKLELIDDPFVFADEGFVVSGRGREEDLGKKLDDCALMESISDFENPSPNNDDGGVPIRLFLFPL